MTLSRWVVGAGPSAAFAIILLLGACETLPRRAEPGLTPPERLRVEQVDPSTASPPVQRIVRPASPLDEREPVIDLGVEPDVPAPSSGDPLAGADPDEEVMVRFVDADVAEVVRWIVGETLERPFVIDPAVGGVVSLETSGSVPISTMPAILAQALQSVGATYIDTGELIRVLPLSAAATAGASTGGQRLESGHSSGYSAHVVRLRHADAENVAGLLEPFADEASTVRADPDNQLIVISAAPATLETLLELVEIFDVDWLQGRALALFPVRTVAPERLVFELDTLFGSGVAGGSAEVGFLPVERLSAILVVARDGRQLERIERWIDELDKARGEGEIGLYVYAVQNGRANDLAAILGRIFSGADVTSAAAADLAPNEVAQSFVTEPLDDPVSLEDDAPPVPDELPLDPFVEDGLAPELPGLNTPGGAGVQAGSVVDPSTRVIADGTNNSIIVLARPRVWEMIEAALDKLDVEKLQVLIEATIAEVTLNDELRYGVEWFLRSNNLTLRLTDTPFDEPTVQTPGFSAFFSTSDVRAVINALDSVTDVNVISTPQLLVVDNELAELSIGDEVPIITRQAQSVIDPDAPIVGQIEYRPTGVLLEVLPRINSSGRVLLEIAQEVSDVVPTTTSTLDSPTIRQRRLRSVVAVATGETVALGGLIREDRTLTRSGVPGLSELPVVGALFGARGVSEGRTEVIVLLTPYVIRDPEEARRMTAELRSRVRALRSSLTEEDDLEERPEAHDLMDQDEALRTPREIAPSEAP